MNKKQSGYELLPSAIHGIGVIVNRPFQKGEIIGLGFTIQNGRAEITPKFGAYINHCASCPSATVRPDRKGQWWVVALRNLEPGDEISVNYADTPESIKKAPAEWTCPCQTK